MEPIKPRQILYIKLGTGGEFEKESIKKGIVKLDYRNIMHNDCKEGNWGIIEKQLLKVDKPDYGAAKRHIKQLRYYYESEDDVLWITFWNQKLWWCFAKSEITLNSDGTNEREVIDKWHDCDIKGKDLKMSILNGNLLKTQGFRGTICELKEDETNYTVRKINGEKLPEVQEAEISLNELKNKIQPLIKFLTWGDFEILVDLIFRHAGWQRVSELGHTQKTIDLDLVMPISGRKAMVQIKSQSDLATFEKYEEDFSTNEDYDDYYYVVHSPDNSLIERKEKSNSIKTKLVFVEEVSQLCISAGLVDWLIERTS